jgi:rSAM/selenodomain-associated transferase 1
MGGVGIASEGARSSTPKALRWQAAPPVFSAGGRLPKRRRPSYTLIGDALGVSALSLNVGTAAVSDPPPCACAIAVMAKASTPGLTKTRLAPPLSFEEAADLNTSFLKDIVENITQAGITTPIATYLAFGPPGSEPFFERHIASDVGLIETWRGDFGDCLLFALEALLARGHASACVLNSDSPTLPTVLLVELAEALAVPGDRVVIGPAEDGGYYVLGLKTAHRRLFQDIAWSTETVLAQTLARAAEIGLPVHLLPPWYDVDDAASLRRLCRDVFEPEAVAQQSLKPSPAAHTRQRLMQMLDQGGLRIRLETDTVASA